MAQFFAIRGELTVLVAQVGQGQRPRTAPPSPSPSSLHHRIILVIHYLVSEILVVVDYKLMDVNVEEEKGERRFNQKQSQVQWVDLYTTGHTHRKCSLQRSLSRRYLMMMISERCQGSTSMQGWSRKVEVLRRRKVLRMNQMCFTWYRRKKTFVWKL